MSNRKQIKNKVGSSVYDFAIGWIVGLFRLCIELGKERKHKKRLRHKGHIYTKCQVIPPDVYRRPDPLIYDQYYLMSLGYGVSWDNPDIQLFNIEVNGQLTPISSNDLRPDTIYEVNATIHNGSTNAPAIGLRVDFSYLSFGIGTISNPIGTTTVDLDVRGGPNEPAIAKMNWKTPSIPGHYCLQVKLVWADDANPDNNLGQENTNVGISHSPAVFEFPVRNDNTINEIITLIADSYSIITSINCKDVNIDRFKEDLDWNNLSESERLDAMERWCQNIASPHNIQNFPIPNGWTVDISPQNFSLGPGDEQLVLVTVTPPNTFSGTQAININAYVAGNVLIGGVTLYVVK